MMLRARTLLALLLPLAAATAAAAQSNHDSNAPLDVASDHIELLDRANRVLLSGNVKIVQAEMTLSAARVTVSYTGQIQQGSPEVSRLDAAGGVTVTRPEQSAQSQYAVYDLNRRVITMIGGVTLRQGPNTVNGGRLTINLDSGRATIDGSGVGGGVPGTTQSQGGRVTGHFSVPKRATPTPSPSPTPQ
jgi:lipopolysaccharide export system protein LptA